MTTYQGTVQDGCVVLDASERLPEGTRVLVTAMEPVAGSPAAVLAALDGFPFLTDEEAEAFRSRLEEARIPVNFENPLSVGDRT